MDTTAVSRRAGLRERFPPSAPCSCAVCSGFCARPGWWTVAEARAALEAGLARRMMLELSPDRTFGVLSPAFRGNGGFFALQEYARGGCTFHGTGGCELFGADFRPLECRFCRHDREGEGRRCHEAIERDWRTAKGRRLVRQWAVLVGIELPRAFSL